MQTASSLWNKFQHILIISPFFLFKCWHEREVTTCRNTGSQHSKKQNKEKWHLTGKRVHVRRLRGVAKRLSYVRHVFDNISLFLLILRVKWKEMDLFSCSLKMFYLSFERCHQFWMNWRTHTTKWHFMATQASCLTLGSTPTKILHLWELLLFFCC